MSNELDRALASPYIEEAVKYWDGWNTGEIDLPDRETVRSAARETLRRRLESRPAGYEDEAWAREKMDALDSIDDDLSPEIELTPGAQLVLVAQLVENLDTLEEQGVEADRIPALLAIPTYLVVGLAQQNALDERAGAIRSIHVIESIRKLWTITYPLCPLEEGSLDSLHTPQSTPSGSSEYGWSLETTE